MSQRLPGPLPPASWGGGGAHESTPEQSLIDGVRTELRNARSLLVTGGEDESHTALGRLTRQWEAIKSLRGHVGNVLRGSTLVTLARVRKRLGDPDEALGLFAKGRAMLEEASDAGTELEPLERLELALALAELGDAPPVLGQIESAAASGVDAAALLRDIAGALDAHGHDDAALATLRGGRCRTASGHRRAAGGRPDRPRPAG